MSNIQQATFAGGCFWCMVKPFDQWEGVHSIVSGYTGGHVINPDYETVKTGTTGHKEAVQITFDADVIAYETILDIFWRQIDPTDDGGQFQDRGDSYRAAIFYHNEEQQARAEASKTSLAQSGRFKDPIVTPILPVATFYPAEDMHQNFYKKHADAYHEDRAQSGRDEFIKATWGE